MQDKGNPAHPLARLASFGNPWHGTVTGTTLTLTVNDATMDWPQITLAPEKFRWSKWFNEVTGLYEDRQFWEADRFGYTYRVRFSGGTGGVAADSGSGRHWLSDALLSGPARQLYGHDMDGWIWQRDDGSRWRVASTLDESARRSWDDPLLIDFTFSPMGRFSTAAQPDNEIADITITDFGMSTDDPLPYPPFLGVDVLAPSAPEEYHAAWLTIMDISSTGRYAIIEVSSTEVVGAGVNWVDDEVNHLPDLYIRCPLAYLLIDLGAPDAEVPVAPSVSVLKRREDIFGTLGMMLYTDEAVYEGRIMRACFDQTDAIVYFEFRIDAPTSQEFTASWVRVSSAGTDLDEISVTMNEPTATTRNMRYLWKYENYFHLDGGTGLALLQAVMWSNNLVGFVEYTLSGFVYSGKLMTAEGPVTVADKPFISGTQTFGSYCPMQELGTLSQRVAFGESSPICWV